MDSKDDEARPEPLDDTDSDHAIDEFIAEEELRSARKATSDSTWLKEPADLEQGDDESQMSPGIDGSAVDEFDDILPSTNSPQRPRVSAARVQEIKVRLHKRLSRALLAALFAADC